MDNDGGDFGGTSGIIGVRRGLGRVKEGSEGRIAGKHVVDMMTALLTRTRGGLVEDSKERRSVELEEFPFSSSDGGAAVRCIAE
jgi:hypothetical protein